MDPISIAASAITVAALAAKTCSALADLRSICDSLPGRLHALNNEVTDLELVLFQLASLIKERASLPESRTSAIPYLLDHASSKLTEVKNIVRRHASHCLKSKVSLTKATAWRKDQAKLQELQEDIRAVKCSLNIMLGASNSQDMMQIRLEVAAISTAAAHHSKEQSALTNQFINNLAGVDERIARVEEMLRAQTNQIQTSQVKQVGSLYNVSSYPEPRTSGLPNSIPTKPKQSNGLGVRVTPHLVVCRRGCECVCHLQKKSSSPTLLNQVLGQLFIGYAGLPALNSKCNIAGCQRSRSSQIHLEYWFPWAFFSSTIMRMQIGYQPNIGTTMQLDTLRRVPDTAQCVNFALQGDIDGLKYLFSHGLASPRDVSTTRGYSVLRWALYGKQYKTCEFLLHAGADPDYRPIAASDNSPRKKACHFLLEGNLSDDAADALHAIASGEHFDDFIDEAKFTQTHRIVLGLSRQDLEQEVIFHPEDIDAQDSMGRTPLAWAAARGDTRAVVTLLSHGADPNITDVQLSGPVSNAASQGHTVSVRLLLEAGAHPDPPKPKGVKKGSPLNCAARNSTDVLLLKSLLDFGAYVDSSGVDGKTALIHAARTDNASFAMLLLEYGADINVTATGGSTPLTTTIIYNSHNVLQLMLDRWHEYSSCPRLKSPDLLNTVAQYADIETLHILTATNHLRLSYDKRYTLADFEDRLQGRPDLTDELRLAFDELLSVLNHIPSPREGNEGLLESGFFSCFTSPVPPEIETSDRESNGSYRDHPCPQARGKYEMEKQGLVDIYRDSDSDQSFKEALEWNIKS